MNWRNERAGRPWRYDREILLGLYSGQMLLADSGDVDAGVRLAYALWIGHKPTPVEAVHLSRNMASLERRGLVVRLSGCRVRLTPAGLAMAEALDPLRAIAVEELLSGGAGHGA